jgi:acetyl-CoA carboxylase biotin carboxyl carrier protein
MQGRRKSGLRAESVSDVVEYLKSQLPALLDMLQATDVRQLEVQDGPLSVRVHRTALESGPGAIRARDAGEEEAESFDVGDRRETTREITSPLVGRFYRAPQTDAPPLVIEGSHVDDDTVVGIVETLPAVPPTEIEAGCRGVISSVLAGDGDVVEYGQLLFEVAVGE